MFQLYKICVYSQDDCILRVATHQLKYVAATCSITKTVSTTACPLLYISPRKGVWVCENSQELFILPLSVECTPYENKKASSAHNQYA